MKHFATRQEVILTKKYDWIILTPNSKEYYKYSNLNLGDVFTIVESEDHGFILERNNNDRFYFCDDFMQEYFDIKTDLRFQNTKAIYKAYTIANNAIYFNDNSDYLSALYEVCRTLRPEINENSIGSKYIEE
jgi:hypothetical protein